MRDSHGVQYCEPTNRNRIDAGAKRNGNAEEADEVAQHADLSKFFDTVNHNLLMRCVAKRVKDERVLKLIRKYLLAEVIVDGLPEKVRMGVPQGRPLSPLLANILLDELDKELERWGHKFVRYADDFIIMVKTKQAGERVFSSVRKFLERELLLEVNETKSKVAHLNECSFLGFSIIRGKIRWSQKSEKQFKRRIKEITGSLEAKREDNLRSK